MNGSGEKYLKGLMKWVVDESFINGTIVDREGWFLFSKEPHVPQQLNSCDCGMFVTVCADFISDDLPLSYDQGQMSHYRQKVGTDIIRGSLLYPMEALRTE